MPTTRISRISHDACSTLIATGALVGRSKTGFSGYWTRCYTPLKEEKRVYDLIGDIHGEFATLKALLRKLEYRDADGV